MPTERVMVCTRPDFDVATLYASYWVGQALRILELKGLRVMDLFGSLATKSDLVNALDNHDPIGYWGVGHGNPTQFAGQDAYIILEKGVDESLFIGRIIHLTSCLTGSSGGLLESLADAGAIACIGYSVDLIVGVETENFANTPDNEATKSLLLPDITIEFQLADGKQIVDALIRSDLVADIQIEYWRKSGHPDSDLMIWAHMNNRDGKVLYGLAQAEYRVLAEPIHPIMALASVASFTSLGLVTMKW